MTMNIVATTADHPDVQELLETHANHCASASPPESCHFLPAEGLAHPSVTLWGAQDADGKIVAIGALKEMSRTEGEIKSMHTASKSRGLGTGAAILSAIEKHAQMRGYTTLWLETGTMAEFAAARRLYARMGYEVCAPFADYSVDPNSAYYTKTLPVKGAD